MVRPSAAARGCATIPARTLHYDRSRCAACCRQRRSPPCAQTCDDGGTCGARRRPIYGHKLGLSVALFAVALIAATLATNGAPSGRRRVVQAGLVCVAGVIPVVEDLNALSFLLLALAIVISIALLTAPESIDLRTPLRGVRDLLLTGPWRSPMPPAPCADRHSRAASSCGSCRLPSVACSCCCSRRQIL
jgi:hypothetical protein